MKIHGIKVIRVHPLRNTNVCTKFCGQSIVLWDVIRHFLSDNSVLVGTERCEHSAFWVFLTGKQKPFLQLLYFVLARLNISQL